MQRKITQFFINEDKKEAVGIILNNMKNCMNKNNKYARTQLITGFQKLFYSYIIKDQLNELNNNIKVCKYDKNNSQNCSRILLSTQDKQK